MLYKNVALLFCLSISDCSLADCGVRVCDLHECRDVSEGSRQWSVLHTQGARP